MARDFGALAVGFQKLEGELSLSQLKKIARKAAEIIKADMKQRAPRDEGKLAESIMTSVKSDSTIDQVVVDVGPSKKTSWRAHFLEFGVRPHLLKTKTARVMVNRATGEVFGATANHPGFPAKPFIRPAIDEKGDDAAKLFAEEIHKAIMKAFQ
jgi:HK97 gp10 family phage protein